ncbi:MAG: hypothetical protein Q9M36_10345 [Sulfurovum sp.]|nr:hypothetical protein [Sulfurovum sp.]
MGILVDSKNNQLLVCNSNLGFNPSASQESIGRVAGLAVYDLDTKVQKSLL